MATLNLKCDSFYSMRMGRWAVRCFLFAVVFASCHNLRALDPSQRVTQYAHTSWTIKDGSFNGTAFALAQTNSGDLWIGTEFGLLTFDGVRFVRWRPPAGQSLNSDYVTALAAAPDGSLWIGTRVGLSHWTGSRVENYPTGKGQSMRGVAAVIVDRSGTVWVGTAGYQAGELCKVEGRGLHCYGVNDGLPGPGVISLHESPSGDLWVGSIGGLCRWKRGPLHVFGLPKPFQMVYSIAEDRNGEIWAATSAPDTLMRLEDGKLLPFPIPDVPSGSPALALLHDRDGGIWMGTTGQGLIHFNSGRMDRFSRADGLSSDDVRSLFEDREGNVWAATNGGLDRFREFPVITLSVREGLSHNTAWSVSSSKSGGVWVGTAGGLDRVQENRITSYGQQNGLPSNSVEAIFEDRGGRLWANCGTGLFYFVDGRFRPVPGRFGTIAAAAEDRDGSIWFSAPEVGLIRVRDGKIANTVPWSIFGNKHAFALASDFKTGGLWLGFTHDGLASYRSGQPTQFYSATDGLGTGLVADLHLARDGTLWAATGGGLSKVRDGRIVTLTDAQGLPCNQIQSLVEDDNGALWMNTACGLVRIDAGELAAWSADPKHRIASQLYDAGEGMRVRPIVAGTFRRAAKSKDGRLWFAVMDGVAVVNPKRIPHNRLAPPVRIQQIAADKVVYLANSIPALPPNQKELQIDYTAFSFVAPEKVRFRYKLIPFETDWHDAGTRRQRTYTNLGPQSYRFEVQACNNDGIWNESAAALDFSIQPAFYQTGWFGLLCTMAVVLLLWCLYLIRMRQLSARLKLRFEATLAERTRISREIHDTLLQNITGFSLQLDALSKNSLAPAFLRERLVGLRKEADEWQREARESVSDLRRPTYEGEDLETSFNRIGQQITAGSAIHFHMITSGAPRHLPPHIQENLGQLFQEAIRNAVRHSHATEIRVSVRYLTDSVYVQIRDDGCGFDPRSSDKINHWGLTTMRERARKIGGELTITATPGQGTTIEIVARFENSRDTYTTL